MRAMRQSVVTVAASSRERRIRLGGVQAWWVLLFGCCLRGYLRAEAFVPTSSQLRQHHPSRRRSFPSELALSLRLSAYDNSSFHMGGPSDNQNNNNMGKQNTESMQRFLDTIISLQGPQLDTAFRGGPPKDVELVRADDASSQDVQINSLVFRFDLPKEDPMPPQRGGPPEHYILAVIKEEDVVNVSRLEEAVLTRFGWLPWEGTDESRPRLVLAPLPDVAKLCGFLPGTVPAVGLSPAPLLTVVDGALRDAENTGGWLAGGGGIRGQACRLKYHVLFQGDDVISASFRDLPNVSTEQLPGNESETTTETPTPPPLPTVKSSSSVKPPPMPSVKSSSSVHTPPLPSVKSSSSVETPSRQTDAEIVVDSTSPKPPGKSFSTIETRPMRTATAEIVSDPIPPKPPPPPLPTVKSSSSVESPSRQTAAEIVPDLTPPKPPPPLPTVKYFFPVETPSMQTAAEILSYSSLPNLLQPVEVTLVGRLSRVRRVRSRLVVADIIPLGVPLPSQDEPSLCAWRSPVSGDEMAVQLIAGQTFFQRMGDDEEVAEQTLRKVLQVGQIVWIQGMTNVGNRESLQNWVYKQSLDVVVSDCTVLSPVAEAASRGSRPIITTEPTPPIREKEQPYGVKENGMAPSYVAKEQPSDVKENGRAPSYVAKEQPALPPGMSYLKVENVFPENGKIVLVNSLEAVREFANDMMHLMSKPDDTVELTGLDCEWKPNFRLDSRWEAQPVLLLQLSLHSLETVYLWDFQTLLRPLLLPDTKRTPTEDAVSRVFSAFLQRPHFIKLGFHLAQDLRRLAASYPHITGFSRVESVLELSPVVKKSLQLSKQPNSRSITASLRTMVQYYLKYGLDKTEQISDWSLRPLTDAQMQYAALDAAVAPMLFERAVEPIEARIFVQPSLQLGRWEEDSPFKDAIRSLRFVFIDPSNQMAIRRLRVKQSVGDDIYVVSQSWTTGTQPPQLPNVPSEDGPFTDASGVYRIPANLISLKEHASSVQDVMSSLLGQRIAKTKGLCAAALMQAIPNVAAQLEEGARVDFAQRSGYVEFDDAVMLFVNMPLRPGAQGARGYPNEWLEDGQRLSWFCRETDWMGRSSALARKLLSAETQVVLCVRLGKGQFLWCGRCRVATDATQQPRALHDWDLVKLYLTLLDWKVLSASADFQELVHPGRVVPGEAEAAAGDTKGTTGSSSLGVDDDEASD